MPPEYIPIQQEIDNLWWRVPLGFLPFFLIFLFFNHVNEIEIKLRSEGREDKDTPEHSLLVGPVAMAWLRVCALVALTRFTWIYFASIDRSWYYEISQSEACCWLVYIGAVVPIWTWNEKELLCLWLSRRDNTRDTLPKE